tara:strand:- start:652 stop:1005 length:354 start_codon:yes stop_codon:yes gene_type:complete
MSNNITKFLNSRVIELSRDKIELGLVQDLEKKVDSFESENKEVISLINKLNSFKSDFKKLDKSISSSFSKLGAEADDGFKKASDLGIDTKDFFQLKAKIAKIYGNGWDMDAVSFLRS